MAAFPVREGGLHGRRIVVMLSGAGQDAAARATELLIDGHAPQCVISARSGGLSADLPRGAMLLADRVRRAPRARKCRSNCPPDCRRKSWGRLPGKSFRRGPLLTLGKTVVARPTNGAPFRPLRRAGRQHGDVGRGEDLSLAASPALGRPRRHRPVGRGLAVRVEHLLAQKSKAGRLGAAGARIVGRPASVKDMYRLAENALVASDRLAQFLSALKGMGDGDLSLRAAEA